MVDYRNMKLIDASIILRTKLMDVAFREKVKSFQVGLPI